MFDTWDNLTKNPNLQSIEIGTVWNEWQDNGQERPVETERRNIGGKEENKHLELVPRRVFTNTRNYNCSTSKSN